MKEFGLIGNRLVHSFSKEYFNNYFLESGIAARYNNYEIDNIDQILSIVSKNEALFGFNVTIPFKQQIIPYLNSIHNEAKTIGAVNVVKIKREDGKALLFGYNTDAIAFEKSIKPLLTKQHNKALILGTGGASKAVGYALEKLGLKILFVSRSRLAKNNVITYSDIDYQIFIEHKVIVNCTPCGMWPNVKNCPPLKYEWATKNHLFYDLIYNPQTTLFMREAQARKAITKNGLEMLYLQAKYAWNIWETEQFEIDTDIN